MQLAACHSARMQGAISPANNEDSPPLRVTAQDDFLGSSMAVPSQQKGAGDLQLNLYC